jgi:hypothetical protein
MLLESVSLCAYCDLSVCCCIADMIVSKGDMRAEGMAQVTEHLTCKCKALSSKSLPNKQTNK